MLLSVLGAGLLGSMFSASVIGAGEKALQATETF